MSASAAALQAKANPAQLYGILASDGFTMRDSSK